MYAVASEDMDTLTFGATRLARHLMEAEARKLPVLEFDLAKVRDTERPPSLPPSLPPTLAHSLPRSLTRSRWWRASA